MQFWLAVGGFVEDELIGEFLERMLREIHFPVGQPFLRRREKRVYDEFEGFFYEVGD